MPKLNRILFGLAAVILIAAVAWSLILLVRQIRETQTRRQPKQPTVQTTLPASPTTSTQSLTPTTSTPVTQQPAVQLPTTTQQPKNQKIHALRTRIQTVTQVTQVVEQPITIVGKSGAWARAGVAADGSTFAESGIE